MRIPTVYMLTSRRNGVLYIGVTSDPARRYRTAQGEIDARFHQTLQCSQTRLV